MAANKNQHFVPQFLLRAFSSDKRSIEVYLTNRRKHISKASIERQCSKDYFYGKDLAAEKALQKLETKFSVMFNRFKSGFISNESIELCHLFILLQMARTEKAAETSLSLKRSIIGKISDLQKENEVFKDFKIPELISDITNNAIENLEIAASLLPYLKDFPVQMISNETEYAFIISDNPVIFANPKFQNRPGSVGIGIIGIHFLCPISPHTCLFVYDPEIYRPLSTGSANETKMRNKSVIDSINRATICNSYNSVYYSPDTKREYIDYLCSNIQKSSTENLCDVIHDNATDIIRAKQHRIAPKYCRGYYLFKKTKITSPKIRDIGLYIRLRAFNESVSLGHYKSTDFELFNSFESTETIAKYYIKSNNRRILVM